MTKPFVVPDYAIDSFFIPDPDGWGCFCSACHKHFSTTAQWHTHAKKCFPDAIVDPEIPAAEAKQLTFGDAAGPWVE